MKFFNKRKAKKLSKEMNLLQQKHKAFEVQALNLQQQLDECILEDKKLDIDNDNHVISKEEYNSRKTILENKLKNIMSLSETTNIEIKKLDDLIANNLKAMLSLK